ncbi:flagellin [Porticoccaceae bacterium]|jgi:flagellin|nr:flagellin [Porticoccaceae bacterium]
MTVINTNNAATITANALTKNERAMSQAMERLSTGVRINSASDDAAGLAISSRMTSQVNGLNMAVRNANDAISLVQTADGALSEVTNMLQRMRELAVQAASGTMSTTDQAALSEEFEALTLGIDAIADNTQWNGTQLLDATSNSGAFSFQVGANASQTISVTIRDFTTDGGSTGVMENLDDATTTDFEDDDLDLDAIAITSASEAEDAIDELSNAITRVNTERAALGSVISRLEYAADNLANVAQNTSASRSRILDADYASETTELARTQIIQQAATAMLSQANQQAQSVLALLR